VPIILAIHGYSATTFEWDEFRDYSVNANYRISQVLLGGHGRDYQTFKASNWQVGDLPLLKNMKINCTWIH
jgi:carboxylesterase